MNLAQARKQLPELAGLDDQSAFDLIHQAYYPTWDKTYLAQQLGYTPPVAEAKQAGLMRTVGDVGIKLAQGAVDLGSSVVGLGSLATGGLLGQGMRAIGYDPHATNEMLGEYLSDSQKAADAKVHQADGFGATLAAAIDNPRAILGSVAESAPGMLGGMGVTSAVARRIAARAALATAEGAAASAAELAAGKTAAQATKAALATEAGGSAASNAVETAGKRLLAIGAGTEGAQSAGQIADDAQAAGRTYSDYALPALAAGALTGSIGYGSGRLMGDSATQLATGARSIGVRGGLPARLAKEAFSEGVLEEMPQSAQEQYFTNMAQGEANRMNGVGNAAATGMLVGGVMGSGMGAMQRPHHDPVGPLTQAVNAANSAANPAANAAGSLPANTIAYTPTPIPQPAAPSASGLNLVNYPADGIDFDPHPDMRGAHQRALIKPVEEPAPGHPAFDNGIPFETSADRVPEHWDETTPIIAPSGQAQPAQHDHSDNALEFERQPEMHGAHKSQPVVTLNQAGGIDYAPVTIPNPDAPVATGLNLVQPDAQEIPFTPQSYEHGAHHRVPVQPVTELDPVYDNGIPFKTEPAHPLPSYDNGIAYDSTPIQASRDLLHAPNWSLDNFHGNALDYQGQRNAPAEVAAETSQAAPRPDLDGINAPDWRLQDGSEGIIPFSAQRNTRGTHQRAPTKPNKPIAQAATAVNASGEPLTPAPLDFVHAAMPSQQESDDRIIYHSEHNPPVTLRRAHARVATASRNHEDLTVVPHAGGNGFIVVPTHWLSPHDQNHYAALQWLATRPKTSGSFSKVNELAELVSQERANLEQQRANIRAKVQAKQQADAYAREALEVQQIAAIFANEIKQDRRAAAQTAANNRRAERTAAKKREAEERQQQPARDRALLLDTILKNSAIPPSHKKNAFLKALRKTAGRDAKLTNDEHYVIELATVPVQGPPNRMPNVIPARQEVAPAQAQEPASGTNFKAVDTAIAAGMRLRTENGNVLHKKGSTKIFRLNQAQKAYYLRQIAQHEAPHSPVESAAVPAPEETATAAEVTANNAEPSESIQPIESGMSSPAVPALEPAVADTHNVESTPAVGEMSIEDEATERKALNRLTVKDMTDSQLIRAKELFATSPRAPKINKELVARGLTAPTQAVPAGNQAEQAVPAPATDNTNAPSTAHSKGNNGRKTPALNTQQDPAENEVVHLLEIGEWIDAFHLARRIGKPFGFVVNMIQGDLPAMYVDTRPMEIAPGLPGFVGRALTAPSTYYSDPWHVVDTKKGKRISAEGKTMEEVVEKVKNGFANATPAEIAEFGAHLPDVSQASLQAAWLEGIEQLIARTENKAAAKLSKSAPSANEADNTEATANPAPTHSEGSTIEAATPAVIGQSIAKSAANTPMNLKQAKADLLAQIDAAMAHVVDERVIQAKKAELQAANELVEQLLKTKNPDKIQLAVAERRLGAAKRAFQMVTFDVPGDGKFTVRNAKENLLAFRARVSSSPGFSGRSTATKAPIPAGLRNSAETSIADMLVENEWVGAFHLARRISKPFGFGANRQGGAPILYVDTREVDIGHGLTTFAGRQVPVLSKEGSYRSGRWYVMDATKGLSIGEGGDTLDEAIAAAKKRLDGVTPEKLAHAMTNIADAPQSTLEAAWLTYAEERDTWAARLRHNLPVKPSAPPTGRGTSAGTASLSDGSHAHAPTDANHGVSHPAMSVSTPPATEETIKITTELNQQGATYAHGNIGTEGNGTQPLAEMATDRNAEVDRGRRVRGNHSRIGEASERPDAGTDANAGLPAERSGGSGVEAVYPADTGGRALRPEAPVGTGTGRRTGRDGSGISGTGSRGNGDGSTVAGGRRARRNRGVGAREEGNGANTAESAPAVEAVSVPAAVNLPAVNFRITDDIRLGQGGEVAKFNDNLAAIRTLRAIEAENRHATPEEQAVLARYVGWGGLANAFPSPDSGQFKAGWEQRGPELAQLITSKEYMQARRSTLDSHYTSQTVVNAMWQAAQQMGFAGGLALESSVGSGNFLGLLPDALRGQTRFIGVELDSLTARMAQLLYPQETILNSGLQKVPLADGVFDLAIGNPPFGEQSLRFQYKPEFSGQSIHNQFFLASVDALKPGGLLVQVVSRYLLDRKDSSARQMLAKKARLVGAIRLPDTAFKENARTEVVTDIVFLQRYTPEEEREMIAAFDAMGQKRQTNPDKEEARQELLAKVPAWINTTSLPDPLGGDAMEVNHYFAKNPHMIMGTLERSGSMQYRNDITVRPDAVRSLGDMLARALTHLPHDIARQEPGAISAALARHQAMSDNLRMALAGHEAGTIRLEAGNKLVQVIERDTPEGGHELTQRTLSPASPWSDRLFQNAAGQWYTTEVVLDESGKAVKETRDGKTINRNVFERRVFASEADIPASMLMGESRYARLMQLVALRDLLIEQLNLEADNALETLLDQNRQTLARAYHAYIKAHGLINDPANAALLSNMPDGALVLALEFSYRPAISAARAARIGEAARASSATPAPILSTRVIVPYVAPERAATFADALSITLAESGKVDMERIAALLGRSVAEIEQEMRDSSNPLLFHDPETQRWETRNDYLSGQVRRKLNAARAAGLSANIAALEAAQPEPWSAENVSVLLGSTWAPTSVYEDFIQHISGLPAKVTFSQLTNNFYVRVAGNTIKAKEDEWGSDGRTSFSLISDLLNNKSIRVNTKDADGKTVIDPERTALADLKARAIKKEFSDWVFQDSERRKLLVELFNDKFNTRVNRQYDGSHLILPGKVPDSVTKMRRHQKNAIWRGIFERFLLLDHAVGAGKTFTAIAIAMERRRMGLSKKPMVIVPNHMVEQFTADAYRLYPGAKVVAAGKTDFEKSRRRRLFAKIATGDADLIILAHSSFEFIGIAPETEERYLEGDLARAMAAIKEAEEEAEENGHTSFRKPFGVKEAERMADKIRTRLEKVKSRKDALLTFEQMGIDHLIVDEAHEFKNLFYTSRLTGVRGMGNKLGSQKATDLYNKVRVLRESPTGAVTFMTGTPISNSAVEMYSMMRYLAADELRELGLDHFDAWRAQYVSTDAGWEPNEAGRLTEVARLGRTWSNMRSLMELYYSFTDSVDNDAIKRAHPEDNNGEAFPIPRVKGGERQSVVIQPTEAQIGFLNTILSGFDSLEYEKDPVERNKKRLKLMDQARKVSLDVRAIAPSHPSTEQGGKLDRVAQEVARIYHQWNEDRGTQLVFLDRSVPKSKGDNAILKQYDALLSAQYKALVADDDEALRRIEDRLEKFDRNEMDELRNSQNGGWNAYKQIKENLIARGIPAREIRFIQEANDDQQKQALFDEVNDGTVRVLIGSTARMGAGTNVQERLVGLHHVDVTWKPSDIEQREGRIIRQKNGLLKKYGVENFEVEILAYATERTIDAKMWSLNATKLKTINAIRKYDGSFVMDFEDEESVSMAELAALASGDPLLLERVKLMSELDKLELLRRQHQRKHWGIKEQFERAEYDIARLPAQIAQAEQDQAMANQGFTALQREVNARSVKVEGIKYTERKAAQQAVLDAIESQQAGDEKAKISVSVGKRRLTSRDGALNAVMDAMGDADAFAMTVGDQHYIGRTDAARAIAPKLIELAGVLEKGQDITDPVGSFLGLPMEATVQYGEYNYFATLAVLRPDGSTWLSAGIDPRSTGDYTTQVVRTSVEKLVNQAVNMRGDTNIQRMRARIAQAQADLPELARKQGEGFPGQAEMDAKFARLQDVVAELSSGKHAALVAQDTPSNPVAGDVAANALATGIIDTSASDAAPKLSQHTRSPHTHSVQSLVPAMSAALSRYGTDFFGNLLATGKVKIISTAQANTLLRTASRSSQATNAEFKHWFAQSMAVDHAGNPLVLYHGTTSDFGIFDQSLATKSSGHSSAAMGSFFSSAPEVATLFAGQKVDESHWPRRLRHDAGANLMPVYVSIANPAILSAREFVNRFVRGGESAAQFRQAAIEQGHDGVLIKGDLALAESMGGEEYRADTWVTFRPEQVKSAIGNNGQFSPNNPDIRYSADTAAVAFFNPQDGVTYLIADAISKQADDKALHGLMLHELANHALQMGRSTSEFKQLLNYFNLMQGGNRAVAAAFARARQVGTDPARLNEEALGYYLEANPTLSFAQKVIAWFRAVIRRLGMALTPLMLRARWFHAVAMMSPEDLTYAAQKVLKTAPQALASEAVTNPATSPVAPVAFSKAQQESLLVSTWNKIAQAKDVYQYPVSGSRDLATVVQTVMPNIKIEPLPLDDAKARSKASRQWRVTLPDGKQAFIFEFGRDLQIDASRLVSGSSRGSSLYAAIANYAYNTGKVLEGDSAGFSEVAQMRRLENMISTALKFGSTDHIRPHPLQRNPRGPLAQRLGMKGFTWSTGDFEHNVAQMMQASYDYIHSLVPEIADVHVTEFSDFTGPNGELYADSDFAHMARRATEALRERSNDAGIDASAKIGSATLKRAAITGTILRGESSAAGRALLGHIGTELHANIGQAQEILYSRGLGQALSDAANQISRVELPAGYVVGDLFNQSGKLSWWHKTIGTMDNLAKRHPAFAQVYEAAQSFLGDVSRYAVVAADKAPTLLPKLENISDILGAKRKKPLTAQDTKAISAPIFEGTLIWARDENGLPVKLEAMEARAKLMSVEEKAMILQQQNVIDVAQNRVWQRQKPDSYAKIINSKYEESQLTAGVVWQDQELRDLFGLSDAQIGLYREFRAAIDQSLTNLTISEMVKLGGKDAKPLLDMAMATDDLRQAADLLTRHFMDLAQMHLDQQDSHLDTAQQIANLAGRGLDLMQRGYAPLTRFGRFTVYVQENGEQLYFGLFESQIEAGKMARRMRSLFPDADVLHGTLSDESYKLFAGISPETVELFGSMVGLDSQADAASTQVYQTYLKLAKSNRSALKRLIERKGIAGFSEDAGRVLAGFIYSNARLTSGNAHLGEIDEAVAGIPKQQGQLVDAAMQLREHIRNPEGNSTMLGGLMFAQFLGGSVASAMVNLTQPLTMTLPYLSQFGGITKAGQRLMTAVRDAGKAQTGDAKLDAALKWAADEGIVAPQEVHYLQAQAAGKGVLQSGDGTRIGDARATWNNVRAKLMLGWGKLFAMAELTNRRVTFIAAWRTAVEQGMANPAHFAREAVAQTQGVYNSGNKPRWARSTLGGLALTFKQYSIAYVELLSRMAFAGKPGSPERAAGQRAALYMVAVLFLMAGADGLPFEKNLEDAIDGMLQRLGYNFSSKRQKQAFLTDVLGEGGADFVLKGVSSLPGMPIDVAGRFGMGNLIPATGLLTKKESYTSDLGELAGPAGDVAKRAFHATGKALGGDLVDAALEVSPQAVRNVAKGIDMLATGEYKDTRGYKVNDVTPVEAAMKMIGFQPESTAKIQDAKGQALNMLAQARMRSNEIQEHLAQGIVSGDVEMQRQARAWRDDWNAKNPETPVSIHMPGVAKRVRAMRQDVVMRTQMTAPKALKLSVRNELRKGGN